MLLRLGEPGVFCTPAATSGPWTGPNSAALLRSDRRDPFGLKKRASAPPWRLKPWNLPSRVTLTKPLPPRSKPWFRLAAAVLPSLSKYWPPVAVKLPPDALFFRMMLTTPAMASVPYWAAAPSCSTSMWSMAPTGMKLRSVVAAP